MAKFVDKMLGILGFEFEEEEETLTREEVVPWNGEVTKSEGAIL